MDTECTLFPRRDLDNYGLASMSATHPPRLHRPRQVQRLSPQRRRGQRGADADRRRRMGLAPGQQTATSCRPRPSSTTSRAASAASCATATSRTTSTRTTIGSGARPSGSSPSAIGAKAACSSSKFPSQSDANDNILCFWRPKAPLKAGSEASFAYRQFWCWDSPERPDMALSTRVAFGRRGQAPPLLRRVRRRHPRRRRTHERPDTDVDRECRLDHFHADLRRSRAQGLPRAVRARPARGAVLGAAAGARGRRQTDQRNLALTVGRRHDDDRPRSAAPDHATCRVAALHAPGDARGVAARDARAGIAALRQGASPDPTRFSRRHPGWPGC